MRRLSRIASLVALTVTFIACTDSPQRAITEPGDVRLSSHTGPLSPGQLALLAEIRELQETLYACVRSAGKSNQLDNKRRDINTMAEYAEHGWWNSGDNLTNNVAQKANQIINDTRGLINNGAIPIDCDDYGDATRADLASDFYLLLEVFASQGESLLGESAGVVACPDTGCDELTEEWGVNVPEGTFGQTVAILVRENEGAFPDPDNFNPVGNSFHFDIFPATAVANNPWTRCIVWEGFNPGVDDELPAVGLVKMVRQDENGDIVELPTQVGGCEDPELDITMRNPFVRGAYKLFAGFPFLPRELHAYRPPRTFGGTGTAASPHWLTVEDEEPSEFLGIWNGRLSSGEFSQPVTVIVTSHEGATVAGDYRVALDCTGEECDPVLYNDEDRFFTGQVDGTTMTFTLEPFVGVDKAVVTLTRSEDELTGTHVDHVGESTTTFNAALTLGETATVVAPAVISGGPNLNVLTAPSAEGSKPQGAGRR